MSNLNNFSYERTETAESAYEFAKDALKDRNYEEVRHFVEKLEREKREKLNRYTTLPYLLELLKTKKISLRNPEDWEDKNDIETIKAYKRKKQIDKLFVLCFAYGGETIHHWKTYANGHFGCCIEFDKDSLLDPLNSKKGIKSDYVNYQLIKNFKAKCKTIHDNDLPYDDLSCDDRRFIDNLPFIKRWPYRFENEFRILWESERDDETSKSKESIEFVINLESIKLITLSSSIPKKVFDKIKELLLDEIGNGIKANVKQSTIYMNDPWTTAARKIGDNGKVQKSQGLEK